MMGRLGLDEAEAQRQVRTADRGREAFVRRYFHQDIGSAHLYEMVLNVERLGLEHTVDQIVAAHARKQGSPPAAPESASEG